MSNKAEVVHIDETSWRQDQAKAWLWVALTPMVTVFTIAATRCGGVARQILGEVARRVIVGDRFPSYGWIEVRQGQLSNVVDGDSQAAGCFLTPSTKTVPLTTSGRSVEPFNARHFFDADSISL
jgi:Transposase IS66 family